MVAVGQFLPLAGARYGTRLLQDRDPDGFPLVRPGGRAKLVPGAPVAREWIGDNDRVRAVDWLRTCGCVRIWSRRTVAFGTVAMALRQYLMGCPLIDERLQAMTAAAVAPARHWQRIWRERRPEDTSWFQSEPVISIALVRNAGIAPTRPVIDVGGGASPLAGRLLVLGYTDVTVLDIAAEALEHARMRLGAAASRVTWIAADVTQWKPGRTFALWHDRAVFHFLRQPEDQRAYGRTLRVALAADGQAIIATFALDGPEKCSGLPVQRHDADSLVAALGGGFAVLETRHEQHVTPGGAEQRFLWCRLTPM